MAFEIITAAIAVNILISVFHLIRWGQAKDQQVRMRAQANFASFMIFSVICVGFYAFYSNFGDVQGQVAKTTVTSVVTPAIR